MRLWEKSLIPLLALADDMARSRIPDWRLFSLGFGGENSLPGSTAAVENDPSLLPEPLYVTYVFSVKTFRKNFFYDMFWNWSFFKKFIVLGTFNVHLPYGNLCPLILEEYSMSFSFNLLSYILFSF